MAGHAGGGDGPHPTRTGDSIPLTAPAATAATLLPSQRGTIRRRLERRLSKAGTPREYGEVLARELCTVTGLAPQGEATPEQGKWMLKAAERIAGEHIPPDLPALAHRWVIAADVNVSEAVARHAAFRGSFRSAEGLRIDALEVSCRMCRRPFDDVAGQECEAAINNEHLRGGPIGERKKRKIVEWDRENAEHITGPTINRRGIEAVVNGEA